MLSIVHFTPRHNFIKTLRQFSILPFVTTCRKHSTIIYSDYVNNNIHKLLEAIPSYKNHIIQDPCYTVHSMLAQYESILGRERLSVPNKYRNYPDSINKKLAEKDFSEIKTTDIVVDFNNICLESLHCHYITSTQKYQSIVKTLCCSVKHLTDEDIQSVLAHLCLLLPKISKGERLIYLWGSLDKECCKRRTSWPVEKQLLTADLFFHLKLFKESPYISVLIAHMYKHVHKLTAPHLIHLLFLINLKRTANPKVMLQIQEILAPIIDTLSMVELAVIAVSHYKAKTKIRNDNIIKVMVSALMKCIPTKDIDVTVAICILKVLRVTPNLAGSSIIKSLLKEANYHRSWKTSFPMAVHLCLLGQYQNVYTPELIDSVIDDMLVLNDIHMKYLTRMLLLILHFDHKPRAGKSVFDYFVNEFQNPSHEFAIVDSPHIFLLGVHCLAKLGVFSDELLSRVFSEEFFLLLDRKEVRNSYSRKLLRELDYLSKTCEPTSAGKQLHLNNNSTKNTNK